MAADASTIAHRLGARQRVTLPDQGLQRAAVLVPLVAAPGGLEVALTLRPSELPSHGGQVSFPGGRVEEADGSRWDTALRESAEELGIRPEDVQRLGQLDDYVTITSYHVTPCVGLLPSDVRFEPDEREVAEAFTVPLSTFLDPHNLRTIVGRRTDIDERIHFYLTKPHVVWGATAAMLTNLLELIRAS